ncbi:hypothetical protein DEJ47_34640 [Streptomyces venezuelae]|uniref:Membrane transport protein MMPL domain-containing protein n=1 Tax=Streptomyces venezuelae TaxID=54571 RepID=A0A5P2BKB3_STRVZ|nr:hypothetical protein DEJ47_34640 [Streptomyces venezuelae]
MRRARLVLVCALLAAVCAGVLAPAAFSALSTGGAVATGTEAERAARQAERFGVPSPDLVLAVSPPTGAGRAAGRDATAAVVRTLDRQGDVQAAWSARTTKNTWLRSKDGRTLLVLVRLKGTDKERKEAAPRVVAAARAAAPAADVEPSGATWANRAIDESVERDLRRAELLAAPVLFVVLVLAYGSVVSALLPVVVAALTIGCAVPILGLLAQAVDLSRVAVSAASAIGFGLAVDYSLFLLARVREESARRGPAHGAGSRPAHQWPFGGVLGRRRHRLPGHRPGRAGADAARPGPGRYDGRRARGPGRPDGAARLPARPRPPGAGLRSAGPVAPYPYRRRKPLLAQHGHHRHRTAAARRRAGAPAPGPARRAVHPCPPRHRGRPHPARVLRRGGTAGARRIHRTTRADPHRGDDRAGRGRGCPGPR